MEANGLTFLRKRCRNGFFPQRTAEARELLKQGMRIGGPMSRVPGEPMTSCISRRRRWRTLVHETDNTLDLGDTVQGSVMLEQAGLSRFEQNMVLTCTKGQRTMTAIAEALLEQHYVHHRGRATPTPTGNASSPNRWRRRDTTRAYLAEVEPIKELTDTAAFGRKAFLTTEMVSRMRRKTTTMRRMSPLCWVTRAKTQRWTMRWQKLCSWTR